MTPGMSLYGDEYNSIMSHIQRVASESEARTRANEQTINEFLAEQSMKELEWEAKLDAALKRFDDALEQLTTFHAND